MSAEARVHWVEAGDTQAARKHGLSVLAMCGEVYVPHPRGVNSGAPSCGRCEEINGPISRSGRSGDLAPHFVYRHFDSEGRLIYVGCTSDPRLRASQHAKSSWWWPQVASTRLVIYPNRLHALRVEREAIQSQAPLWNVRHQDFTAWQREQLRLAHQIAKNSSAPDPVLRRFKRLRGAA